MATKTSTHSSLMVQFVLHKYWTFSKAVFSLAKTISSVKMIRRDFTPIADCVKQAKALIFKESMMEIDRKLYKGHLQGYGIQTRDRYNCTVHYTTERFSKDILQKLNSVPELPILYNSTRQHFLSWEKHIY